MGGLNDRIIEASEASSWPSAPKKSIIPRALTPPTNIAAAAPRSGSRSC